jgi:hypothetical protein
MCQRNRTNVSDGMYSALEYRCTKTKHSLPNMFFLNGSETTVTATETQTRGDRSRQETREKEQERTRRKRERERERERD